MRTTLAIDDDVMEAARALANRQRTTVGAVVSDLARRSLTKPKLTRTDDGYLVLDRSGSSAKLTLEIVNALRDADD